MIAKESRTEKLWEEVDSRIKEGGVPQGGVSVVNGSSVLIYSSIDLKNGIKQP